MRLSINLLDLAIHGEDEDLDDGDVDMDVEGEADDNSSMPDGPARYAVSDASGVDMTNDY